jgi:hypothetical protein
MLVGYFQPWHTRVGGKSPYPQLWNAPPLQLNSFAPLPLGSIKPLGWLRSQLEVQAAGLSGHLEEFWPDLGPGSGWLGGQGESWERGPYYLDGLVPLAFGLDSSLLRERLRPWIEWSLGSQLPGGYFGPQPQEGNREKAAKAVDWWPRMVMLKVLRQYQEATDDSRVLPFIHNFLRFHQAIATKLPLHNWAAFRWQDELLSVIWAYNRTRDANLLNLAQLLRDQGFDWIGYFQQFPFRQKVGEEGISLATHGVNNAMALKTAGIWWQISGNPNDKTGSYRALELLDTYHGQPNGMFAADEHYAGREPTQGAELCAVVEMMYSMEELLAAVGDARFGDRLEQIAFNALPGTFSELMWSHQYDQQVNQVACSMDHRRHWTSNGPDSNIFGLEPFYGCCTANMHQGWPKLVSHLWMATVDGGLAAVAYGPNEVTARVNSGETVRINEETGYPFRESIKLTIHVAAPIRFPLRLRIPSWTRGAEIVVGGEHYPAESGTFSSLERLWKDGDVVQMKFPMEVRAVTQVNNGVSIFRGPLVFSLDIGERWVHLKGTEPHADYEVFPTTEWNYAVSPSINSAEKSTPLERVVQSATVEESPIAQVPFGKGKAPVKISLFGQQVASWREVDGSAGPLPVSPVETDSPLKKLSLVPYGSTRLRITVFPVGVPKGN